jgi:hypothetical protein
MIWLVLYLCVTGLILLWLGAFARTHWNDKPVDPPMFSWPDGLGGAGDDEE